MHRDLNRTRCCTMVRFTASTQHYQPWVLAKCKVSRTMFHLKQISGMETQYPQISESATIASDWIGTLTDE